MTKQTEMEKARKKENDKQLIKEQLWRNGHSAKDVSLFTDYDILVDREIKLKIATVERDFARQMWDIKMDKAKKVDVVAIVLNGTIHGDVMLYANYKKGIIGEVDRETVQENYTALIGQIFKTNKETK